MTKSTGSTGFLSGRQTRQSIVTVLAIGLILFALISSLSGAWSILHGFTWRSQVRVTQAELHSPDRLTLNVASCNADPEVVMLRETDDDVQVIVTASMARFRGGYDDCDDSLQVQLQQPLGDRIFIDMNTGQALSVKRGVRIIEAELLSPDMLVLSLASCHGDPQTVLHRETDLDVQITLIDFPTSYQAGNDCQDSYEFRLRNPLGDRIVVDAYTGQPVNVSTVNPAAK